VLWASTGLRLGVLVYNAGAVADEIRTRGLRVRTALAVTLFAGEAVWAVARTWRRRSAADRLVGWADASTLAAIGLLCTPSVPRGERTTAANWARVVATAAMPVLGIELQNTAEVVTAAGLVAGTHMLLVSAGRRDQVIPAAVAVADMLGNVFGFVAGARHFRRLGTALANSRATQVGLAASIAADEERIEQYRLVHDSALQTFGLVAEGLAVDTEVLRRRAGAEYAMLSAAVAHGVDAPADLAEALSATASEFALLGLRVDLELPAELPRLRPDVAVAVVAAAREALHNVRRHSGVTLADLHADVQRGGVRVTVADSGCGFDQSRIDGGTGTSLSIVARIEAVGGRAQINSRPGRGTTVCLEVPADGA